MILESLVGPSPQQLRDVGKHNERSCEGLLNPKTRDDGKVGRQCDLRDEWHAAAARSDETRPAHSSADQNGVGGAIRHTGHEAGSGRSSPKEDVCHEETFRQVGVYGRLRRVCEVLYGNEK